MKKEKTEEEKAEKERKKSEKREKKEKKNSKRDNLSTDELQRLEEVRKSLKIKVKQILSKLCNLIISFKRAQKRLKTKKHLLESRQIIGMLQIDPLS